MATITELRPHRPTPGGPAVWPDTHPTGWGRYTARINRWRAVTGRRPPTPTETTTGGRLRLNPRFVEWLMGLPDGWITNLDLPYQEQLRILGNGVVPQQAARALTPLIDPTPSSSP